MILFFLLPTLGVCFSWATSISINQSNYQDKSLCIPRIPDPLILYTIRDLETLGAFSWNITHTILTLNSTHDLLQFHITRWPSQLINIAYDVLITQKNENFRVYHANISQYQTHIPWKEEDYKDSYSLVLFPVGFSISTLTMGFMWMPIRIQEIFVIHYMDHGMGTEINNQNFGDNWVSFCIVYIKKEIYNLILKTTRNQDSGEIKKKTHVPYMVGLQKIHTPAAKMWVKQSPSRIFYSSEEVESMAIPLQLTNLLDTRTYVLKEKITILAKIVYLIITIAAFALIICFYRNNKGRLHEVWPLVNIKGTSSQLNPSQQLVEEN